MKLKSILEDIEILKPSRSPEERLKNYVITLKKKIQNYIKNGCKGDFDLNGTPIERLPENLKKVSGTLDLSHSKIKELPDDLVVGKDLWLHNTEIQKLPKNLKVGGDLAMSFSKIKELPDDLVVGGSVSLIETPLSNKYSREEIRRMVPGVKGHIYI